MSRVGHKPIRVPDGVKIDIGSEQLVVTGSRGELTSPVPNGITFQIEGAELLAKRTDDVKQTRAFHGLARALAANAVIGVSEGFKRELEIQGIGYRASMEGSDLKLQLGFSHPVVFPAPSDVKISTPEQTKIVVEGIDMGHATGHEQEDHALCFGGKVRHPWNTTNPPLLVRIRGEQLRLDE